MLPNATINALRRSFGSYVNSLGEDITKQAVDRLLTGVQSIVNPGSEDRGGERSVEVGMNPATVRGSVLDLLKRFENPKALAEELNLDFKISVATDVTRGAGIYVKEAGDADVVDAYPAWELVRVYDRDVPRGMRSDGKGGLIAMPGDDWKSRWIAAGAELIDGRMIALKSDDIWQRLGDGIGGYTDTLGNPYPPFAFNSGYDVNNISRAQCYDLGLLKPGQRVPMPDVDVNNIFATIREAA